MYTTQGGIPPYVHLGYILGYTHPGIPPWVYILGYTHPGTPPCVYTGLYPTLVHLPVYTGLYPPWYTSLCTTLGIPEV